jgi:hypothetical protein
MKSMRSDLLKLVRFYFRSSIVDTPSTMRSDRPSRARTRDEIFALYCTFGEKPYIGYDFLSKTMNVLREAIEGLLSHAEVIDKNIE